MVSTEQPKIEGHESMASRVLSPMAGPTGPHHHRVVAIVPQAAPRFLADRLNANLSKPADLQKINQRWRAFQIHALGHAPEHRNSQPRSRIDGYLPESWIVKSAQPSLASDFLLPTCARKPVDPNQGPDRSPLHARCFQTMLLSPPRLRCLCLVGPWGKSGDGKIE